MASYEVSKVKIVRHDVYVCKLQITNQRTGKNQMLWLPAAQLSELHKSHYIKMDGGSDCYCTDERMRRLVEAAARSVGLI